MLAEVLALALALVPPVPAPPPADPGAPPPVEPAGPAGDAGALAEAGQLDRARALLARSAAPEARYLRGLAAVEGGADEEALGALGGLEVDLPELADRIAWLRGRALSAIGLRIEALAALGAVGPGSLLAGPAALARARLLAEGGDRAAALDAVAAALAARGGPELESAALRLAGELLASGPAPDPGGARRALVRCWVAATASSPACLAALATLPGAAGEPPDAAAVVARAEGELGAGRTGDAVARLEVLLGALPPPSAEEPLACRARAALGRALRRAREPGRAAAVLGPVVDRCVLPEVQVPALFNLAAARAASGDREGAIALELELDRRFPSSSLADDALLEAASLEAADGRLGAARATLARLVREHPDGDRRDEARFRAAWLAHLEGEDPAAIAALAVIAAPGSGVDVTERERAAYWRARLLEPRGPAARAEARRTWEQLVADAPVDYYALLARARLAGEDGVGLPGARVAGAPAGAPLRPGRIAGDPHFRAGVRLLAMGLARAAAAELRAVDPDLLGRVGEAPDGPVLALATLLAGAGDHRSAHQLLRARAGEALRRAPEGEALQVWAVAYPAYRPALVQRSADAGGVPAALLLALMREESALDPEAVSPVGAIGLTQLMVPTARELARGLRVPPPDEGALRDPEVSIPLGAAYLGQMLRRFDGSVPLALAAYNAGPRAVSRWRGAGAALAVDEFIEAIPFEETRGYVKRVLHAYAAYLLLGPEWRSAAREPAPGGAPPGEGAGFWTDRPGGVEWAGWPRHRS